MLGYQHPSEWHLYCNFAAELTRSFLPQANSREFARLSQDILQSCIRNTELAQQKATQKGLKQPIAAPIYKSAVAKAAQQEQDEREKAVAAARQAARAYKQDVEELVQSAAQCCEAMTGLLTAESSRLAELSASGQAEKIEAPEVVDDLVRESLRIKSRMLRVVDGMDEGRLLGECRLSM